MSAVNKSVSMLYDLPTSRSSLLAICQQWAYNLSLKFSNMEIYGSRFFTDRIHMAHRFASFATENHDLSPFNPPWTAPEVRLSDPGRGGSPDAALVVQALHASHRARAAEPAADCAGGDCLNGAAGGHWGWEGDEAWHIFLVFLQFLRFFVRVCFFRGEFLSNLFKTDLRSLYASRVWMICGRFSEDKRGCTWSWLGGC